MRKSCRVNPKNAEAIQLRAEYRSDCRRSTPQDVPFVVCDRKFGQNRHVAIGNLKAVHLIGEASPKPLEYLALFAAAFDQNNDIGRMALDFLCNRLAVQILEAG